jgi:hypothetical protein
MYLNEMFYDIAKEDPSTETMLVMSYLEQNPIRITKTNSMMLEMDDVSDYPIFQVVDEDMIDWDTWEMTIEINDDRQDKSWLVD